MIAVQTGEERFARRAGGAGGAAESHGNPMYLGRTLTCYLGEFDRVSG
jgi:hypothetical protein